MRACRPVAAVSLVLTFATVDEALACSCPTSGPPCQATWSADAVFAGRVRSVETIDHQDLGAPYESRLVKFDVERGFVNAAPGPVDIITGRDGPSCGYSFETGKRYLVYAWKTRSSRLSTGICSRTRPLEEAEEDLRYLTAIPAVGLGACVYGRVIRWQREPFEDQAVDYGPVEGLVVSVRSTGFVRDAATDANGRYEITGIPPGKAILTLRVPPELDSRYLERELELKDPRACAVHDFQVSYIAQASGTVVDAAGRPVAGVFIDAVAEELAGYQPPPYQQPVRTDERGWFEFGELPPGRYVFGVNLTKLTKRQGVQPTAVATFLPGTPSVKDATVIELKPGDRRDIGVLRLSDVRLP